MKNYYVYILSNWNNKVIYIGVTNNLERRIYEHQNKLVKGFSQKYNLSKLVYFEITNDNNSAIIREKEIKKWRREKKNQLIESMNPNWEDLFDNKDNRKISKLSEKEALFRNDKNKITGLIIAAGLSSRMGKFKPLLNYNGKTFLENIVDKLNGICDTIIIVTGYNSSSIKQVLSLRQEKEKILIVNNPDYEKGMFSSIKKGIEEIGKTDWILYHQIDQPNLPQNFYNEFVHEIDTRFHWIQPRKNERNGHPILFGKYIVSEILHADQGSNLRSVSNNSKLEKKYWDCDYHEIFTDIDTPEDFDTL